MFTRVIRSRDRRRALPSPCAPRPLNPRPARLNPPGYPLASLRVPQMFHFGAPEDILPYHPSVAPHGALGFATRTANICIERSRAAGLSLGAAFDVGCAVGRTSFDLSAVYDRVVGLDFSHAFIAAAESMRAAGVAEYECSVEGSRTTRCVARMPADARCDRVTFTQGDACALPSAAALGGKFHLVHAANLLCRLPRPVQFLESLPDLLVAGGLVVLVSPYSWLRQYTAQEHWLGGAPGSPTSSFEGLTAVMTRVGFKLVHTEECPFLIREHARKFQWGISHVTVWQKA